MILGNTNSVADNLYYLLWIKDSGLQESKFPVRIPDTILISGRQLTNWYFTGSDDIVLKKKTNHLHPQAIYDSFTKSSKRSDIVAQIIYSDQKGEKLTKIQQKAKQLHLFSADEDEKVVVKYLNKQELHKFLFEQLNDQHLDESVILQKFIDPYGDCNNCIQAIWSPSTCFFTRRINNRHLTDTLYDPYERAVTFDGPEIFSKAVCLKGKQISGEIRKLSENIVKRIAHVTYERTMINRMTLYFKADFNNQLYFLYCTSLRLKDEIKNVAKRREINPGKYIYNNTPLLIDNNFQRPPNMKNIYTVSTTQPLKLENDLLCLNCEQMYQHKDMMEIPFTYLMRNNEVFDNKNFKFIKNAHNTKLNSSLSTGNLQNQLSHNNMANGFRNSKKNKLVEVVLTNQQLMDFLSKSSPEEPFDFEKAKSYVDANQAPPHPLLAKLYPKMTKENYAELKEKGNFDSLYIKLCHNCYFSYTQNSVITGAPLSAVVNFKEINKNRAAQNSNLFTPEMHRIALQKNYELSKEFDFVRYQRPETYEQRLELLSRDTYFKQTVPQQLAQQKKQIKQKTDYQNAQNQNDTDSDDDDTESIQKDQQDTNTENYNDQQQINIKGLLLKQQQKKDHQDIEKMYFNKKERPHTTKSIKSTLLDSTEKFSKRFDLLVKLAEKSISNQRALELKNNPKDLKGSDQQLTDREKYISSYAHSSKQTEETNDDSFSKKKNSILEIYLNNCDQKSQQKQQEILPQRANNPIYSQQQEITSQSSIQKQQSPFLKRSYINSKNEITTGNFSATSYQSIYTSAGENTKEKFLHKSPSSHAYLTSKSYSRRQLNREQNISNSNSNNSGIIDFSNKSTLNRPNTTQNVFRLSTIQEGYGNNTQKAQKNPYLPYKQQTLPNKQQSATDRIQILKDKNNRQQQQQQISSDIKQNKIEEYKLSNNRFQKSYTSQSSRQKVLVKAGSIRQQPPVNNYINNTDNSASKISDEKNIYIQQGYLPTEATNQQTDTSKDQETQPKNNLDEQVINSFQSNSNHKFYQQKDDGDNQSVNQIYDNLEYHHNENQQENNETIQNNDNQTQVDNEQNSQNKNQIENENIQKYFLSDDGYQKEMENIIEDYKQQKE